LLWTHNPFEVTGMLDSYVVESSFEDSALLALLAQADSEFARRYPERNGQRRGPLLPGIRFFVAYRDSISLGCCGLQESDDASAEDCYEVKRLFVVPEARGTGVVDALMQAIESVAVEKGGRRLRFETGERQPEAIHVALRHGYKRIKLYQPYTDDALAQCFAKTIA
jgi:putative acetyltransferase